MKRLSLALLLLVLAVWPVWAQPVTVIGPITPGDCALFNSNTILKDAGFSCNGASGPVVFGPNTSVVGDTVIWGNATGNQLADAGYPPRIRLTANTTFYVNNNATSATCGTQTCSPGVNVSTCGLTITTPCQSLVYAIAAMANQYDFSAYTVALQVADGTYNECLVLPDYFASFSLNQIVTILGNPSANTNVIINCTTQGTIIARNIASRWGTSNLEVESVGGNHQCVVANSANFYVETGTNFGVCALAMQGENAGGIVTIQGTLQILATASNEVLLAVNNGGEIAGNGAVTINGASSLTYGDSARVASTGYIDLTGMTFTGFSGVTATKYLYSDYTGYINSASDPNTILPGNVNGIPMTLLNQLFGGTPPAPTSGQGFIGANSTLGLILTGNGTNDVTLENRNGANVCNIGGNTTTFNCNALALVNPLMVAEGGTGNATATAHSVPVGEGTGAQASVGPCNSNVPITGQGASTDPQCGGTIPVANGGTGNATAAAHSIPVSEGTSAQAAVGPCATNQVIVGGGASADPTCGTNVAGAMVNLATLTASSSASLSDTTHITSTYKSYLLVFQNLVPATTERIMEFQVHSGGSFQSSGYNSINILAANSAVGSSNSNAAAYIPLTHVTAGTNQSISNSAPGYSGQIILTNPSASAIMNVNGQFGYFGGGGSGWQVVGSFSGAWSTAGVVDGFQVQMDSGNITSGSIIIYGIL
jgi:hypothetical protein